MSLNFVSRKLGGCTQRNNGILCILKHVRFAGGGGRPGGKPTLNWKEKKMLRLSGKDLKKATKMKDEGYFADIEHLFDESNGKVEIIDFDQCGDREFTSGENIEPIIDDKMIISLPSLFGSTKTYGLIERKENKFKAKFSHSRVFGCLPRLTNQSYGGIERKRAEKAAKLAAE